MAGKDCRKELLRTDHAFYDGMDKTLQKQRKQEAEHVKSHKAAENDLRRKGFAFIKVPKVKLVNDSGPENGKGGPSQSK